MSLLHVSFLCDKRIRGIQNHKSYVWGYIFLCTEADFLSCFASPSPWLGGVGLHCGRSWISLLAGIMEWAVKMIKDSSNILPLGDKWWERESEPGRMCEIESTQRQDIFQCQLSLVCFVDGHSLCGCNSGQITDPDPCESGFHCFHCTLFTIWTLLTDKLSCVFYFFPPMVTVLNCCLINYWTNCNHSLLTTVSHFLYLPFEIQS